MLSKLVNLMPKIIFFRVPYFLRKNGTLIRSFWCLSVFPFISRTLGDMELKFKSYTQIDGLMIFDDEKIIFLYLLRNKTVNNMDMDSKLIGYFGLT